jgi:hypothetical protein
MQRRFVRARHPLLACALLSVIAACAAGSQAASQVPPMPSVAGLDPEVEPLLVRLRAATEAYRDLNAAVAAGYRRESPTCLAHAPHGAMGYHHDNPGYVDGRLEVERPEILTYERDADGRYALTGAEYVIPYQLWPRDSTPPTVFGRALKRADRLGIWYLHVWAWKENPSGLFADWNPTIRCP